jgi:hypothetical protein
LVCIYILLWHRYWALEKQEASGASCDHAFFKILEQESCETGTPLDSDLL